MTFKKITSLLFLIFFVYSNTEIGQLFKISNLVQHYLEHKNQKQEQTLSFLEFAIEHYQSSNSLKDLEEHDDHKNLPFKTQTVNLDHLVLVFEEIQTLFAYKRLMPITVNQSLPIYKEWYISNVFVSIWQPPKLV